MALCLPPIRHTPIRQTPIPQTKARRILSPTAGFVAEAGSTHSLTPARNCTYSCAYCYVPTLGIYGGLKPEDWRSWGRFTTFKTNAAALLLGELRPDQTIYCSPLVDPYQPAEGDQRQMPGVLGAVCESPPRVFVLQTRGLLILRDLGRLQDLRNRTALRVSFSIPTDRDDVLKLYEPRSPSFAARLDVLRALRQTGFEVYATLAPILPCDPENLAGAVREASGRDPIGDPLHVRAVKRHGATTRQAHSECVVRVNKAAFRIAEKQGQTDWLDAAFQDEIFALIRRVGPAFETGPRGFARLAV